MHNRIIGADGGWLNMATQSAIARLSADSAEFFIIGPHAASIGVDEMTIRLSVRAEINAQFF